MNALALDTATEVLCLSARHGDAWASLSLRRGLQHSPALVPLARRLMDELGMTVADLDLVVCSVGPGSFTGIRIGISAALGIGHGRGIPVAGVSTLDALARPWAPHHGDVFPVIDARRGAFYTAAFRAGERRGAYLDLRPSEVEELLSRAHSPLMVGPDAPAIRALVGGAAAAAAVSDVVDPKALLALGVEAAERGELGALPRPLYLRPSEAERASGR